MPDSDKLRIFMNTNITMSRGKYAAHAVHAALTAFGVHPDIPVVVLGAKPRYIEDLRVSIHDHGTTELKPGTLTAGTDYAPPVPSGTGIDRDDLAKLLRQAVRVGSIGPNSEAIIESGGTVALTYYESEEAADRLLPWLAERLAKARADALEEAVRAVDTIPTADPYAYGESDPFGAHVSGWETAQEHAHDAIRALIEKETL